MTRITLENENGKYSVEVGGDDLSMTSIISNLVAPVLIAAGYDDQNIKDLLFLD